ncbi:ABC transporter ATP-binding protein [Candidatus Microgenomates bacterium]|jgi:putative ABC transport system ATP-binding protein/ATP-binding cassette subfamily B protein|nr:ABC transporter ATP-binding protein [Candidatus Microgenomates bacterium]
MILQKIKQKCITSVKVLKFVYGNYTFVAILRDILFLISTFAEIYGITVLGKFIDEATKIFLEWKSFELVQFLGSEVFLYLALILTLSVVALVCTKAREYLYNVIYEKVWEDAQCMIVDKVSRSNLHDIEKDEFQDKVTYAPAFSMARIILTYDNFSTILSSTLRLVSALAILYSTMGLSVLFLLIVVLPEVIVVHLRRRNIREYQDSGVGKLRFLNYIQNIALTVSNFLELRVNNIYSHLKRRYVNEYDEYLDGYLNSQFLFYRDNISALVVGQTLKFVYIIYIVSVTLVKGISFGSFKALYDYVDVAYSSVLNILNSLSLISNNLGYVDKFFELIEYKGFGDQEHGDIKLANHTPKLEFKNLSFAYPDDPSTKILKNLDVELNPGEKIAFFGGDGSGKSTTVKILTGLYPLEKGGYLLDGHQTKDLDRGELKRKLSVIFQDFINYHFSLKENIVISGQRINVENDLYKKVSDIAGVNKFKKMVHIDDTSILGKTFASGRDLSPGYWQRLAIARMLYRNKRIFIMDEPFTYIDDVSAEDIINDIFEFLGKDRSLIFITRSTKHLEKFDRIYYFENGRVIESGSWKELMKSKGRLYEESKLQKVS